MLRRIFLITFLAIITCFSARAEVFIVTSNADSGPGTLREALTKAAANGSAEKDFIYFNLPDVSEAGRTIILTTQLPDVSSNLVIDGSTQPDAKFGVSDAGVKIVPDESTYLITKFPLVGTGALFLNNVQNAEIYGLYIAAFAELRNAYQTGFRWASAVFCYNSTNIIIGAPGKGNVFYDNDASILGYSESGSAANKNITIQANIIDADADGNIKQQGYRTRAAIKLDAENLLIGGPQAAQSNIFGNVWALELTGSQLQIENNRFGLDKAGNPLQSQGGYFWVSLQASGSGINIINNKFSSASIVLTGAENFRIAQNMDVIQSGYSNSAIILNNSNNGVIGSENVAEKNSFIANLFTPAIVSSLSTNIRVLKNSIYCSSLPFAIAGTPVSNTINVLVNSNAEYSGTATPNSDIYVYEDNTGCDVCNPIEFYTKLKADAAGNWKMTGNFTGKRWVSNALLLSSSTEFTRPEISSGTNSVVLSNVTCGNANGSIEIKQFSNIQSFKWFDSNDQQVGTGHKITNLKAGTYYAIGYNGNCSVRSAVYTLFDDVLSIDDRNKSVIQPVCSTPGSITGLSLNNAAGVTISWKDQDNKEVGKTLDLSGLGSGTYKLTVTDATSGCQATYGPIVIKPAPAPPTLNENAVTTTTTPCGQSTGSVTGIKVAPSDRTYYYSWKDRTNAEVANTPDLMNKPAGFYKLVVTDGTPCGTLTSAEYEIKEINGITIDISKARGQSDRCGQHNAGVTVPVTGATSYEWRNLDDGTIAGTQMNLTNVKAGRYQLTAKNAFCSKNATFTLRADDAVVFPDFAYESKGSCVDRATGSITVNTGTDPAFQPSYYIWEDAAGKVVGTDKAAINLLPGKYRLTLIDKNGCRNFYKEYTVPAYDQLTFAQYGIVNHIKCGLGTGGVTATTWKGGSGRFTYQWFDGNDQPIPEQTANFIDDVPAGKYRLHLTDEEGCTPGDITFEIRDDQETPNVPVVTNIDVCEKGPGIIRVVDPYLTAIYRLYDSPTSTTVLDEKKDGVFKITITETRSYYVALTYGECESARAEVKVSLGDIWGKIANTFTPNADGRNDYWQIPGIENYTNGVVSIFSRNGQMIYQSKGYANPFDGTYKGKELPAGVYYYVIDLKKCNLVSGHLTLIR